MQLRRVISLILPESKSPIGESFQLTARAIPMRCFCYCFCYRIYEKDGTQNQGGELCSLKCAPTCSSREPARDSRNALPKALRRASNSRISAVCGDPKGDRKSTRL